LISSFLRICPTFPHCHCSGGHFLTTQDTELHYSVIFYNERSCMFYAARRRRPQHKTRKAVTRGRTDHFATGVTYLQFPIQICFSSSQSGPPASRHCCVHGFPNFAFTTEKGTFSSSDLELSPTSLTDESGLDRAKMNHRAKYLPQRLFTSKVMVRTHRQTQPIDRLLNTATKCSVITTCHCHLMKTTFEV